MGCVFLMLSLSILLCWHNGAYGKKKTVDTEQQNASHEEYHNCSIPPVCHCTIIQGMLTADCESKNISSYTIPQFDEDVKMVILSLNNITRLPKNNHFGNQLLFLHLRHNNMSEIDLDAFQNLTKLTFLDLSENLLTTKVETLQPGVFRDLKKLQTLHLGDNSKFLQPIDYPGNALRHLVSLKYLSIDGQANKSFGPDFGTLAHLEHLYFSGLSRVCEIITLKNTTFQYLTHIKTINASSCNIHTIELYTFSSLPNLTHLILSNNLQLGFKDLKNITHDLQFTSIKIFELEKVHHTFGLGTSICRQDLIHLNNTSLEILKIDSNRVELFEEGVLTSLPITLVNVTITDNKLTFGIYAFEFKNMLGLMSINITNQFKTHDMNEDDNDIVTCSDSRVCEHQEATKYLPQSIDSSPIAYLNTNINVMKSCPPFKCFPLPPNVEIIDFSSSGLKIKMHTMSFQENSLKQLYLSDNIINVFAGPIDGLEKLQVLDLSHNFCSEVSDFVFDKFPSLKTLYIQNNFIGFSLRVDKNGEIFKNLSKLLKLDISNNNIDMLPKLIFKGLCDIEWINLSNNSLGECNFSLSHMSKLKFLDLSFNRLTSLSKHLMNYLDTRVGDDIIVSLTGNDFVCSCDTLDFVEFFQKKQSMFISSENYSCKYKGHLEKIIDINLSELRKACTSYTGLIIGVLVMVLFSICTIVAGIIYRFRWKLRYLYYMAKSRYMGYTPVHKADVDDYMYDAFIAYSDLQRTFVTKDMIQQLEQDTGLSLCIHHRDFLPGNEIGANITEAVHNSRRTVAVVSRDFLQSYWCMFELNMARMESIYSRDGRNTMFLILYENDIPSHLPLEFYDLIESNSYIEYPNDAQGNIVFWNKVRESLTMPA